jgi:hypothetical protein
MKIFAICILLCALSAMASNVRDLYLPPWYAKAARQIFQLELKDLKAARILLDHPCTVSLNKPIIEVTNGVARAILSIDLRTTPSTFPLMIVAVDARGQMTEYEKLMCHLSLVPEPIQVHVQGDTFALTNLTEEPFELERAENLTITSHDARHILGTLKGSGRLKLKGRAEITLVPNRRAEVLAGRATRGLK